MQRMSRPKKILIYCVFSFMILFPMVVTSHYYQHIIILALMWVIIGSAWNLLAGFTGQVSFGHAVFFGTGAYTTAILATKFGVSPLWGIVLGGITAALVGLVIGWICFRLRGPYFALATIAMGEIFRLTATNWEGLTNGMVGMMIMQTFKRKLPYYYLACFLVILSLFVLNRTIRSKWGYYFVSIREDQDAAESLGIPTSRYKNIALLISSFFTGVAGAFYMNYMAYIDPEVVFSLHHISIMAILVAIIGGVGTLWGPVVGAFVMIGIQEMFRSSLFGLSPKWLSESHVLVFGLLVILVILFLPKGLVGDWGKLKSHFMFLKKKRMN